jgi:hypothetical protein
MDLQAKAEGKNNVSLQWNIPETENPPKAYQIYRNDALLKELPQTEYVDKELPDGNYTYFIRAIYADDCETLSYNVVTVTIENTGIVETDNYPSLRVYPNPTDGQLRIANYELQIKNIEIFDLLGHVVAPLNPPEGGRLPSFGGVGGGFDISHLPAGMYFVRITTDNGIITKKIIKY